LEITDVTIAWRTGVSAMLLGVVLVGIALARSRPTSCKSAVIRSAKRS
jgi:hypothetical protein